MLRRSRASFALSLLLLVAACGGPATTPGGGDVEASATASPAATASATDAPTGDGELCAVEFETCPLAAGTYETTPFEPNFSFTVDDGWTNDRAWPDGGGISKEIGGVFWAAGVARGTVGEEEVEIGADVEGFVAFLASLGAAGMTVSDPAEVTIDGAAGQQIDVESNEVEAFGLFFIEADQFNLAPDEKARFMVVEQNGETVIFIVESFAADDFEEWTDTAQPVIDSITWEE